jgi:V/A-type H+-transporting ATPase subunit C
VKINFAKVGRKLRPKNDFTFAVATVRVWESRLLDSAQIERMLAANSAAESFRILNDTPWSQFLSDFTVADFEKVLAAGLFATKREICKIAPDPNSFDFLWIFFDLQNAKILTKDLLKNLPPEMPEELLSPLGSLPAAKMSEIIFEQKEVKNWEWLVPIVSEIETKFTATKKPEIVEEILTAAFFEKIVEKLDGRGEFLQNFFAALVDFENLKARLRGDFKIQFLPGGKIAPENFTEKEVSEIISEFPQKWREEISPEISAEKIDWAKLENCGEDLIFRELRSAKFEPEKIDAVFAFFWSKLEEVKTLRQIFVGKLNNLPAEKIRKNFKLNKQWA